MNYLDQLAANTVPALATEELPSLIKAAHLNFIGIWLLTVSLFGFLCCFFCHPKQRSDEVKAGIAVIGFFLLICACLVF